MGREANCSCAYGYLWVMFGQVFLGSFGGRPKNGYLCCYLAGGSAGSWLEARVFAASPRNLCWHYAHMRFCLAGGSAGERNTSTGFWARLQKPALPVSYPRFRLPGRSTGNRFLDGQFFWSGLAWYHQRSLHQPHHTNTNGDQIMVSRIEFEYYHSCPGCTRYCQRKYHIISWCHETCCLLDV